MTLTKFKTCLSGALLLLAISLATADFLVDSFETLPLVNPGYGAPYTNVSQSTLFGVTEGSYSLNLGFTNDAWGWLYTVDAAGHDWRDANTYSKWVGHNKLRIDLHRPALDFSPGSTGWNLEVVAAMNGPQGWQQLQLLNWAWLNNGDFTNQTLVWDYSAIRDAAPASGSWWQLAILARGSLGGTVYLDNARFTDRVPPVNTGFTFPTTVQGWGANWGTATHAAYWDATDATNSAASGSLLCFCDFTNGPAALQDAAYQVWDFSVDPNDYGTLGFDLKVDPGLSTATASGDFGAVQLILRSTDIGYQPLATFPIPASASNSFVHYSVPLYQPVPTNLVGMNLLFQTTNAQAAIWYYVDNILFLLDTNVPSLAFQKALPGLEINAAARAAAQRQNIRTTSGNYNWTTAAGAVTYSMSINEGLPAAAAGAKACMFLVGTTNSNPGALADWDEANGLFLELTAQANGLCNGALLFKTNSPASNGVRYAPEGTLLTLAGVPMVGTWTLTLNGQSFALSAPGGGSASTTVPTAITSQFSTNVFAYFGLQPVTTANLGQFINLASVQITGAAASLNEVFTSQNSLNTSALVVRADYAGGIQMRPSNVVYRFSWPAPSVGFELQSASILGTWTSPGLPKIGAGPRNVTFLPSSALPSAGAGFFRLKKP